MLNYKLITTKNYRTLQEQIESLQNEIYEANEFILELRQKELGKKQFEQTSNGYNLKSSLVQMQEEMGRLSEIDRQRSWIAEGIANFAEILRKDYESIRQLSQHIISNMVKYLKASQGGLFFTNEDGDDEDIIILELMACYAYDRQKNQQKQVIVSNDGAEGLVGQSYVSKKSIYLPEIPADYHKIDLGLGASQPNNLLVSPLISNGEIFGVIEVSSFNKILPHQIEFVEKVGESIASTIMAAKISEKTQILLYATRKQTIELQQQEEELRENMAQLENTQQNMRKVNQELKYTFSTINSAMLSAEFTLDGHLIKANDRYLKFVGYTWKEIEGKHHEIFVHEDERSTDEYKTFWQELAKGKHATGEFRRVAKNGFLRWIRGSYYPVKDEHNQLQKVLKVAYDITLEKVQEVKLFEQQKVIEENQRLLQERTKSIQDKAYQKIKTLKEDISKKDAYIKLLEKRINYIESK